MSYLNTLGFEKITFLCKIQYLNKIYRLPVSGIDGGIALNSPNSED